jgi:inorganic phosphate transporter, PiT family
MLVHLSPSSSVAIAALIVCLALVLAFEATNGFHDAANAVATVIYTNSLRPVAAVVLSGIMNFLGVLLGGIAVAYALVELLPPEVLSPPDGSPAVPMLVALLASACLWNLATWYFAIPNSSSHCIIGALVGIAIANSLIFSHGLGGSIDWNQVWKVLCALALSPALGFLFAGGLHFLARHLVRAPNLYRPPEDGKPPVWWIRCLLILTCTGVSFSHGTNDGQKSIGLIMLAIIGLFPAAYALNPAAQNEVSRLDQQAKDSIPLLERFAGNEKNDALRAAKQLADEPHNATSQLAGRIHVADAADREAPPAGISDRKNERTSVRAAVYVVMSGLKKISQNKQASADDKHKADQIHQKLGSAVEYAPWWVRILSALTLGLGTMFGYKRIVHTLGERLGRTHLTPMKGAATELVAAGLIGTAGISGLPVSTTHIVASGIAGTMVLGEQKEAGLQHGMVSRIVLAWIITLPVTIALSAGLFYLLNGA